MPAFGDALSPTTSARPRISALSARSAWPQATLNFPRAFFTEKAFPENEVGLADGMTGRRERTIESELIYEQRLGARGHRTVAPVAARRPIG